jgi:hypothetical protein
MLTILTPSLALCEGEDPVFAAPEDAIRHFVAALAENDLQKALQACAVEEYADGYDFAGMMDRLKALMPVAQMAPSEYDLFREMNRISAMGDIVRQIKMMVYSFFVPEVSEGTLLYSGGGLEEAEAFQSAVDPSQLKGLVLLLIDTPNKEIMYSETNIANFQKQAKIYGAQDLTERVVLYQLGGKIFEGGFGLLLYEDSWKIFRLNSNLAGQSSMGTVTEAQILK